MKPISFSNNSWHWKVMCWRSGTPDSIVDSAAENNLNICQYVRALIWEIITLIVIFSVSTAIVVALLITYMCLFVFLFVGWKYHVLLNLYYDPGIAWGAIVITLMALVISFCHWGTKFITWLRSSIGEYFDEKKRRKPWTAKPPSFIALAWTSFKEKTCVKITIIRE